VKLTRKLHRVLVELPDLDYKQLDRLIAHKRRARPLPNGAIIPHKSKSVKTAATYISEDGEIVAKQIRQSQKRLSEDEVAQIITAYQGTLISATTGPPTCLCRGSRWRLSSRTRCW